MSDVTSAEKLKIRMTFGKVSFRLVSPNMNARQRRNQRRWEKRHVQQMQRRWNRLADEAIVSALDAAVAREVK